MLKILFLLLFVVTYLYPITTNPKRVLIVHSYEHEYRWTKAQNDSFIATLQAGLGKLPDISVEHLDTKRHTFDAEYQLFFRDYLRKKYSNYSPDIIYVTDDNALTFFRNYKKELFSTVPLVFSGVNNLSLKQQLDPREYQGIYETKEIIPNIELIRQFSPQTRDIWILGDGSSTYFSIETEIKQRIKDYPKYHFHFIVASTIDEILLKLPTQPKSFLILTTIGNLKNKDGTTLSLTQSISALKKHTNLILCSMEDAYVQGGVIGGYVTSGEKQGSFAAHIVQSYLKNNTFSAIPIQLQNPNIYMFDRQALMESRIILSEYIARNSVILSPEKTFFEQYQEEILNAFFIFIILFLIFSLVVFIIAYYKNRHLRELQSKLTACNAECQQLREQLSVPEDE